MLLNHCFEALIVGIWARKWRAKYQRKTLENA